MVRFKMPRHVD